VLQAAPLCGNTWPQTTSNGRVLGKSSVNQDKIQENSMEPVCGALSLMGFLLGIVSDASTDRDWLH